jgi:hypothetical protein
MAEDKVEPRELNWRQLLPWTVIFQGFRVALDPNKLLLAAGGILAMSLGWWVLAQIFADRTPPAWEGDYVSNARGEDQAQQRQNGWKAFKKDLRHWNLHHEACGSPSSDAKWTAEDLADSPEEVDRLNAAAKEGPQPTESIKTVAQVDQMVRDGKLAREQAKIVVLKLGLKKPSGALSTLPWSEDRGPNPYLLVTGQAGPQWEKGQFWDWLLQEQLPVLVEPLIKLFLPVKYFFHPSAGFLTRFYALLVLLWTVVVWGFFGAAITRIAAVQVARQERIGLMEAVRFAARKYLSYVSAPIFPLLFVAALLIVMILFGWFHMIPILGDLVFDGLLWPVMIALGLFMGVVLVGLVGWPLMAATISTEGTDSWEAVSRAYSYVYQAPWHYIWYSLVALGYGAVIVFFVGLMGSLMVYLSKWGVSQTPGIDLADRNPSYLFVYAPESFGWRQLLLQGMTVEGRPLVAQGEIDQEAYAAYLKTFRWWNYPAAILVSIVWVGLVFMLIVGFGYSYFWSASTIIYLLMRRKVDDAEMDEVYLDEEEEGGFAGAFAPPKPAAAPTTAVTTSLPMVEPPQQTAPPPVASPVTPTPPGPDGGTTAPSREPQTPSGNSGSEPPGGSPG